ncbi:MAG: hypothetical protein ACI88C_000328, partial [Acidimicrobiales bacterium]
CGAAPVTVSDGILELEKQHHRFGAFLRSDVSPCSWSRRQGLIVPYNLRTRCGINRNWPIRRINKRSPAGLEGACL